MKTPHTPSTHKIRAAIAVAVAFGATIQAKAASTGMPWESGLDKLKSSLTGPVAGIISIIAIFLCGATLALGGDNLSTFGKRAIYVVIAASLIMGAASMVTLLWGSQGAMLATLNYMAVLRT
jgi:type IV secretion system protein VirB2